MTTIRATGELDDVWGQLAEAGVPVVVHCGSGPIRGRHTGPGPFGDVLRKHPRLTAVIAHLGMPEYAEHLALTSYPNVHLDTTMALTPFTESLMPFPRELTSRLGDLQDRIVLGSDFPNIPYEYAVQLSSLESLDLATTGCAPSAGPMARGFLDFDLCAVLAVVSRGRRRLGWRRCI